MTNIKRDIVNKVLSLLYCYNIVCFQDDNIKGWKDGQIASSFFRFLFPTITLHRIDFRKIIVLSKIVGKYYHFASTISLPSSLPSCKNYIIDCCNSDFIAMLVNVFLFNNMGSSVTFPYLSLSFFMRCFALYIISFGNSTGLNPS